MLFLFIFLTILNSVKSEYKYETKWINMPVDHFGFQNKDTFRMKYLQSEDFWDSGKGPIFFYTGNEGQIELFAQHTGLMWELAPEFEAKLVFAEHRYYGASMPYGDKSLDNDHIGYLTSSQAMADFADLINYLQGDALKPRYPVIVFGGSYGGMLAAYMRMKYPHLVTGAIAASAPVHMFPGMIPCEVFNRIVTSNYNVANLNCVSNIKASWSVIREYAATANGSEWLHKNWHLCNPVNSTNIQDLIDFMSSMYTTMAMVNYPFPSDFLMPLPGQPVRFVCQYLNETLKGQELLEGLGKVINIFTNYGNKNNCVDFMNTYYGNLNASGWDYQACTEMVMPICATGKNDMFEPSPWNFTEFSQECHRKYNTYPKPDLARIEYGGGMLQAASNIVFSNGLMDPWAAGGILSSLSDTIKSVVIVEGAHHLDLMTSNPADPESVKMARNIHKQNIRQWINEFSLRMENIRP